MHQAFLDAERADVVVELGVCERLVDIEELYALICVV